MKVLRPKDLIDLVLRLQKEICDDSDTSICWNILVDAVDED